MDKAREQTDKILSRMEKRITKIYSEANEEITEKWDAFMESHEEKLKDAYDDLQEALKSGDREAIAEARDVYERTAKNITVNNKRFEGMVEETAQKISHVNEVALAYVNGQMPQVYTINYNEFGNQDIKGYSFSLVNEDAVKNLARSNKILLPEKKVDVPKDVRWNVKNINSQMMQGILQGESIPKLAKRLGNVSDMNKVSAIRNARTMTTSAENGGRQDSFKRAQSDGVKMGRVWVSAHDDRTRAWHLDLNGVEVGIDEPWENDYGEIMYPGDPSADPANVYNCRCSIRAKVYGFNWNDVAEDESEPETIESAPSDDLNFANGIDDNQKEIVSELFDEYDSRLENINRGAHHGAGDVDITGSTMRLSSHEPTVAVHEFAHTLANTRADKYGLTNDQDFWSEIRKVRTQYRKAIKEDYSKMISTYADADNKLDEFMAEAFTQAKAFELGLDIPNKYGDDLTFSSQVLDIINKYFKRKR